jgi:hypothetical protein
MTTACIQETIYNPATGQAWSFRSGDRLHVDGRVCEFLELDRRPGAPTSRLVIRYLDSGETETLPIDLSRMDLEGYRTAPPRLG